MEKYIINVVLHNSLKRYKCMKYCNVYTYDYLIQAKELLLWVLHFTTLLIEHSFSRHLYNSMEHLVTLLSSCDMHVVLGVLNLLYMFSKRSNFITRLNSDKRQALLSRLNHLAEVSDFNLYFEDIICQSIIHSDFAIIELGRQGKWFWLSRMLQGISRKGKCV